MVFTRINSVKVYEILIYTYVFATKKTTLVNND